MTENEKFECAIHCAKYQAEIEVCEDCKAYNMDSSTCKEIAMEAIKALEEVQEYRKIGTLEELKAAQKYIELSKKHGTVGKVIDACAEYESIGTVEELKSLKENGAFTTKELITIRLQLMALEEYQKIGTVEECREARKKMNPRKY